MYKKPFPYFIAMTDLHQESISASLSWFEAETQWKLVEAKFYEQHELVCTEGRLPDPVAFLTGSVFLDAIRLELGGLFDRSFAPRVDWSVHKLLPGQRIRIHNDLLSNGETHRVILHLNRGWSFSNGGFLMLFNSANPVDVHRVLIPVSGSIVGFEISANSNHAVSLIRDGQRFAVVYSLYAENGH